MQASHYKIFNYTLITMTIVFYNTNTNDNVTKTKILTCKIGEAGIIIYHNLNRANY